MSEGIVNQLVTERFRTSSSGESFTISGGTKPDGTSWAGPTITNISGALYSLAFTPTAEGVYLATITGNTSGKVFSGAWDIGDDLDPALVYQPLVTTTMELVKGDDYLDTDGRAFQWSFLNTSDLTGATATLTLRYRERTLAITCTVSGAGEIEQIVKAELTAAQTATLYNGTYVITAVLANDSTITLARGRLRATTR